MASVVPARTGSQTPNRAARAAVAISVFVAELAQEKGAKRRPENAKISDRRPILFRRLRQGRPDRNREKRRGDDPFEPWPVELDADEEADSGCCRMVQQHRHEDAEHDRPRTVEAARQHEREKLRLVAKLGDKDEAERNEKGFHVR